MSATGSNRCENTLPRKIQTAEHDRAAERERVARVRGRTCRRRAGTARRAEIATASSTSGAGTATGDGDLDERREHDEEAGDERGVRRRGALEADVLQPVAREADRAERERARRRTRCDVASGTPGRRQPRRIANGASTIAPTAKRNRMNPTRRDVVERVLHDLERGAVGERCRDQRELGQQWPRRLPRSRRDARMSALTAESAGPAIGDRQAPVLAERLGRHAHAGRRLPPLVLVPVDQPRDALDERGGRRPRRRSPRPKDRLST